MSGLQVVSKACRIEQGTGTASVVQMSAQPAKLGRRPRELKRQAFVGVEVGRDQFRKPGRLQQARRDPNVDQSEAGRARVLAAVDRQSRTVDDVRQIGL